MKFEDQFILHVKNKYNTNISFSEKIQMLFSYLRLENVNMAISFLPNPVFILPCVQSNLESNLETSIETLMSRHINVEQDLLYVTINNTMLVFNSVYNTEQKLDSIYNLDKLKNMKAFW